MPAILLERPESYTCSVPIIGSSRRTGRLMLGGCMDDRPFEPGHNPWASQEAIELMLDFDEADYDPSLQLDIQTAAGLAGITRAATIALAAADGGELRFGSETPEVVSDIFNQRTRYLGLLSIRHQACAGDAKAYAAMQDMANGGETLWLNTLEIYPVATEKDFDLCSQAARTLPEHIQVPTEDEIIWLMECDETRAPLVPELHTGRKFIADWRKGTGFRTREAREAGHPAYYTNFDGTARLAHAVGEALPVPEGLFNTSTAMNHAALVGGYLPHPDGPDKQVGISRLDLTLSR